MCNNSQAVYMRGVHKTDDVVKYIKPDCGLWSCPECGTKNASHWGKVAMYGVSWLIDNGLIPEFLTLTSHRLVRTVPAGLAVYRPAWKKLSVRLKRASPQEIFYMSVYESKKTGHFHVHFVGTFGVSKRWFKDNAAGCGLGYQVELVDIDSVKATAWYVTKYLTKQFEQAWPKGTRRVNVSQNWPTMPQDGYSGDFVWQFAGNYINAHKWLLADCDAGRHVVVDCDLMGDVEL